MAGPASAVDVVRAVRDRFAARDRAAARAPMVDDLVVELPTTGEPAWRQHLAERYAGRMRS